MITPQEIEQNDGVLRILIASLGGAVAMMLAVLCFANI